LKVKRKQFEGKKNAIDIQNLFVVHQKFAMGNFFDHPLIVLPRVKEQIKKVL
jgi:hypothetical protein